MVGSHLLAAQFRFQLSYLFLDALYLLLQRLPMPPQTPFLSFLFLLDTPSFR